MSEHKEQKVNQCPLVRDFGYKKCPMLCVHGYEDCEKQAFYPDNSGLPAWIDKNGKIHP